MSTDRSCKTVKDSRGAKIRVGDRVTAISHGVLGFADSPALDRPPLDRLLRMVPDSVTESFPNAELARPPTKPYNAVPGRLSTKAPRACMCHKPRTT